MKRRKRNEEMNEKDEDKYIKGMMRRRRRNLIESLTLNISYTVNTCTKNFAVSCCYRSPTPVIGFTHSQQYEVFINKLDSLLHQLSLSNHDAYIFLDSNVNLLDLPHNDIVKNYMNTIIDRGFLPTNMKATRMSGYSSTLIDHILTNCKSTEFTSGSIIEDISDHWLTFMQPLFSKNKAKPKTIKKRQINKENLDKFKLNLQTVNWDEITNSTDADDCYDKFWALYSTLFDLHFPWVTSNFNRNVHKISNFMTSGLLISRKTKLNLLKLSLAEPSEVNKNKYKQYRNIYNSLMRASKKLHIEKKLKHDSKNPRKVWDTLKELTTGKSSNQSVDKIVTSNNVTLNDPLLIVEEFKNFFVKAGKSVSESVSPVAKDPVDLLPKLNPPEMYINEISQGELVNIIEQMESKSSLDINGLSTKLIKFLRYELSTPLVHLFNLSIREGKFPSKLKASRTSTSF